MDDLPAETESRFAFRHRPVDLTHLSRYTMGNSDLEQEVLELFRRQPVSISTNWPAPATTTPGAKPRGCFKASARGVGAWQILQSAEDAEQLSPGQSQAAREDILRMLDKTNSRGQPVHRKRSLSRLSTPKRTLPAEAWKTVMPKTGAKARKREQSGCGCAPGSARILAGV